MEMRKCETDLTKVSTAMIEVPEKSNINERLKDEVKRLQRQQNLEE